MQVRREGGRPRKGRSGENSAGKPGFRRQGDERALLNQTIAIRRDSAEL